MSDDQRPPSVLRTPRELGQTLAEARNDMGMDQLTLAEWAGVDRSYISDVEQGRHATRTERLFRLLDLLGLELVVRRKQPGSR